MRNRILPAMLCMPLVYACSSDADIRNSYVPGPHSHFSLPRYKSKAEWETRRIHLRRQILSAAGLLPLPAKTPLHPVTVRRLEHPGYTIDVVVIESMPGYYLAGNLYRPAAASQERKVPAVLVPHGHWKRGRLENLPSYSVPALCINLALQGYAAFSWDMAGYNDSRQTAHNFGGWEEQLWSFSPMGVQMWNSMRAVDYLESLPDIDSRRIGATGASGGATQTFLLAAVDDRIRFAAPVNMVSATMQGADPCEEAPNLRLDTSNVEFAAMMAPRPMLLVSSTRDWTRLTPQDEYPAIRDIYKLYGMEHSVDNAHIDAEHNYNMQSREAVYRFFSRHVEAVAPALLADQEVQVDKDEDMLAFAGRELPEGALDYRQLFQYWREAAERQSEATTEVATLQERLRYVLAAAGPARVSAEVSGTRVLLQREGSCDRVPGYWFSGKGEPVVVVHPDGSEAGRLTAAATEALREGRPMLAIDAFQTGKARTRRDIANRYFLSYNQTDDANRVQDILTALAFVSSLYRGPVQLAGFRRAGIWCLFAAAVSPANVKLSADLDGFSGTDDDFHNRFFVPGIRRAGGLPAALKLVRRFRVTN